MVKKAAKKGGFMIKIQRLWEVVKYAEGLEAVIFDLDDTLYSEKSYVRSGYRAAAKVLCGISDAEAKLWAAFEEGKPAVDEVLRNEGKYTPALKEECLWAYRFHMPKIELYSEVLPVFSYLKEAGIRLGIITDGRIEGQRAKIEALGLREQVEKIIITDELGGEKFRKPCGEAFRIMARYFSLPYEKMGYVGDNLLKDRQAPEKLGMRFIWFYNKEGIYKDRV